MSTSMTAGTYVVDPLLAMKGFDTAEKLLSPRISRLRARADLRSYVGDPTWAIDHIFGCSRSDWFSMAVKKVCTLTGINGLGFFYASPATVPRWKLPLFLGPDTTATYGDVCGYWLQDADLKAAQEALIRLLEWSKNNLALISGEDFLGYFEPAEGIRQALEDGNRMTTPDMTKAKYAEDGDGPGYFFAYLCTARHLVSNAVASDQAVLHVSEVMR